jgi:soluble lytic murein transglycosylase
MQKRKKALLIIVPTLTILALLYANFDIRTAFCGDESKKEMIVSEIVQFLKDKNVKLSENKLESMANTLYEESRLYDLDYRLVLAIIKVESNFRFGATSRAGAKGLMQIKPSLAKFISGSVGIEYKNSKDLHEPDNNIKLGTYHISKLMEDFKNVHAALHAYNVGARKAQKRLTKEDEPSTPFTRSVLKEYHKNTSLLPEP